MKISRLHHAQVSIPKGSEDKVREFYCFLLGMKEVEEPKSLEGRGGLWIQLGDVQVHFGVEDGVDRFATKAHLAYLVEDLKFWRSKFSEKGVETIEGVPIPGYTRFEFRDPFGNRVEFLERSAD